MTAVTGANGLLGSFILRTLSEKGVKCIAIKRANSDTQLVSDLLSKHEWRNADVMDPVSLEDALDGATKVIHAAALVSFNPAFEKQILDINVNGTRNVVNACLLKKIEKLVHISSVAALGRQKDQRVIDETNKWVDNSLNTAYARSKYLAELEVFRGQEEGLDVTILNPSLILAPADWNKSSAQVFKYIWDEKPFYFDSYLNVVDVRDVATAAINALDLALSGERIILNAGKISLSEFIGGVAARFGKKAPSFKLGKKLLHVIATIEIARAKMTGSTPLITRETAKLAGTEFLYSNEKAAELLDFQFEPIDETLNWCCDYYLNYNNKK